MRLATEKLELVDALSHIPNLKHRRTARQFLEGLSTDELRYIAAYLGAQLLDPALGAELSPVTRAQLAACIEKYEQTRGRSAICPKPVARETRAGDLRHKMILLLEYLSLRTSGDEPQVWSMKAGTA